MVFLKPIDEELLDKVAKKFKHIITVEEGVIKGGLGSAVLEFMSDKQYSDTDVHVHRIGIEDKFITHGSINELQEIAEINPESILKTILKVYFDMTGIKLPSEETAIKLKPVN